MLSGTISVDQMLAGQVAGMSVVQTSGSPTAAAKIRIRGTSSIIGNKSPLWILDGVVLSDAVEVDHADLSGDDAEYLVGNAISGVNPSDIESITILKDASATAIYGVQAANGVIVVTTKKGRVGKARISYSGGMTVQQRENYNRLNLMTAEERITLSQEIQAAGLHYPRSSYDIGYEGLYAKRMNKIITRAEYEEQLAYLISNNTDWFDILYRNSISQQHSVSVSGGDDQTTYYTSVGYDNSKGTARKEETDRFTMTSKLNSRITPKLFLGLQINASYSDSDGYNTSVGSPRNWAYNTSRAIPCYNSDGSFFFYEPYSTSTSASDKLQRNYLYELDQSGNNSISTGITSKANLTWQILPALKYEVQGSFVIAHNKRESHATEDSYYVSKLRRWSSNYEVVRDGIEWDNSPIPQGGVLNKSDNSSNTYNLRNQFTYNKTFNDHVISLVGISEIRSENRESFACTYYGYMPERGYTISPAYTTKYMQTLASSSALVPSITNNTRNTASFRGIACYSYQNKYTLNGNISMDGSNQFGSNPKYRFLPIWSIAGKWTISEEKFLKQFEHTVPYLALRASYGIQGNVDSGTSPDLVLKIGDINSETGLPQSSVQYYPNEDLRWEKTTSYNIGLDYSLWNDKLSGTFDFYDKVGTDMIMHKTISAVNGRVTVPINAGDIRNVGFEASLRYTPVNTKDWTFYTEFIYSYNKNTLLKANAENETSTTDPKSKAYLEMIGGSALIVGEALGTIYSYDFAGLNHDTGLPVYRDKTGSTTFSETADGVTTRYPNYNVLVTEVGLVKSGVMTAPSTGSLNLGLRYRNWRLNTTFMYTFGGVSRLPSIYNSVYKTFDPEYNVTCDLIDRWKAPGDEMHTNIPVLYDETTYNNLHNKVSQGVSRLYGYAMYDNSSARICSTDNLRLRSVSINYNVPAKLLKKYHISVLSIRFQMQNLFIIADKRWHGADPELGRSATSSIPRSASLGLNVTF